MGSVFTFLGKVLSSKSRDLFTVKLASTLLLSKVGLVGFGAKLVGPFLEGALGMFLDFGILGIDLTLDSYREGKKIPEFKAAAGKAYAKATAKIYDEAKKEEIRREYLEIVSRIGVAGDGPK